MLRPSNPQLCFQRFTQTECSRRKRKNACRAHEPERKPIRQPAPVIFSPLTHEGKKKRNTQKRHIQSRVGGSQLPKADHQISALTAVMMCIVDWADMDSSACVAARGMVPGTQDHRTGYRPQPHHASTRRQALTGRAPHDIHTRPQFCPSIRSQVSEDHQRTT